MDWAASHPATRRPIPGVVQMPGFHRKKGDAGGINGRKGRIIFRP